MKNKAKLSVKPVKRSDVPVTAAMLNLTREELKSEIREVKSDVRSLNAKVDSLDAKMDARFLGMQSELHRIALLVEEQNARNVIVLDGLSSLFTRQTRVEDRQTALEKTVLRLK